MYYKSQRIRGHSELEMFSYNVKVYLLMNIKKKK